MKTVFEHIEYMKEKPHHVRKRFAFAVAAGTSVFIAFVWFVGSVAVGEFALKDTSFADQAGAPPVEVVNADGSNLAGAAAALQSAKAPAHIEIVDTASSSRSVGKPIEQTTIPF